MHLQPDGPVLVVGAGAIGVLVAARLAAAGHDVQVAARDTAAANALGGPNRLASLRAEAPSGARTLGTAAVVAPGDEHKAARLLVLATKCADAAPALRSWLPHAAPEAPVVALQNGVLGDALAPLAKDRYIECSVALPATLHAAGHSVQTGPGRLHIGPWPKAGPRDDPAAFRAVAQVLAAAAPVQASGNMLGVKWTKLAVNNCITSLGVLAGIHLGDLLAKRRAQEAFLAIVRETVAAGHADGVRFESVGGFRPTLLAAPVPGRKLLLTLLARKYRRHRSSSLQSLDRGRHTEVDFLNGHVVATARKHGLEAPVNAAVVAAIHRIEAGDLQPHPDNLGLLPLP